MNLVAFASLHNDTSMKSNSVFYKLEGGFCWFLKYILYACLCMICVYDVCVVCLYVYAFVFECRCLQAAMHFQRSEDIVRCQSSLAFFEIVFLVVHRGVQQTSWPLGLEGFSYLYQTFTTIKGFTHVLGIWTQVFKHAQSHTVIYMSSPVVQLLFWCHCQELSEKSHASLSKMNISIVLMEFKIAIHFSSVEYLNDIMICGWCFGGDYIVISTSLKSR